jgi:hypothetical protein
MAFKPGEIKSDLESMDAAEKLGARIADLCRILGIEGHREGLAI